VALSGGPERRSNEHRTVSLPHGIIPDKWFDDAPEKISPVGAWKFVRNAEKSLRFDGFLGAKSADLTGKRSGEPLDIR
jgi:hypothetical protein